MSIFKKRHTLLSYFAPYLHKGTFFLVLFFSTFAGIIAFFSPIINTNIIDKGVQQKDMQVVVYMLLVQLSLFIGNNIADVIRAHLMLKLNNRFSISILKDFLTKLSNLPICFFDKKSTGDLQQRINDHSRIQYFLTTQSMSFMVSIVTFFGFVASLTYFNSRILLLLLVFSILNLVWIFYFQRQRKELDHAKFRSQGANQDNVYELINGMQELKLNNASEKKIDKWHEVQYSLAGLQRKTLKVDQKQNLGSSLLSQIENLTISFIAAYDVIHGRMSLGMMMSIGLIVGQIKGTINNFLFMIRSYQDASISTGRLMDIHKIEDEDAQLNSSKSAKTVKEFKSIVLENISYQYPGSTSFALKNINVTIERGDTVAIVGNSGSGKTTLLKLLQKFYKPTTGTIYLNSRTNFNDVLSEWWRSICGVIMQDGYVFSDSIAENIAMNDTNPDYDRLEFAARMANILEFIHSLPDKWLTQIGAKGLGLSGGQKQRILIARAIYKDPEILIFDEATSALDAENEEIITENIRRNFPYKTKIIIAHRYSTIRNADKIIVLDEGKVVETGNHYELIAQKGKYHALMASQLNLNSEKNLSFADIK